MHNKTFYCLFRDGFVSFFKETPWTHHRGVHEIVVAAEDEESLKEKENHFREYYFAYDESGTLNEEQAILYTNAILTRSRNKARKIEIEKRLKELSEDFIQESLGAVFEDIEDRKEEFRTLHNELRELLDLPPREYEE